MNFDSGIFTMGNLSCTLVKTRLLATDRPAGRLSSPTAAAPRKCGPSALEMPSEARASAPERRTELPASVRHHRSARPGLSAPNRRTEAPGVVQRPRFVRSYPPVVRGSESPRPNSGYRRVRTGRNGPRGLKPPKQPPKRSGTRFLLAPRPPRRAGEHARAQKARGGFWLPATRRFRPPRA